MPIILLPLLVVLVFIIIVFSKSITIIAENRRGAVFRFGRFFQVLGPGLRIMLPYIDSVKSVNLNEKIPGWQGLSESEIQEKVKNIAMSELD